jgi:hypothetical protein
MRELEKDPTPALHFFHPDHFLFHGHGGLNKAGLGSGGIQYPFFTSARCGTAWAFRYGSLGDFFVKAARLIQGFRGQSEMLHLIGLGPLDGWLKAESEAGGFSQLLAIKTRNSASKSEAMISTR